MQLLNVRVIGQPGLKHLQLQDGKIAGISDESKHSVPRATGQVLNFEGALVFPGLINSHDHLDFNSFLPTRNRIYNNYIEWGADIHQHNKTAIDKVLSIPRPLRVRWGIYKNLLAGITTVVNHGNRLAIEDGLINVFQDCQSIHSIRRGKHWRFHLNRFGKMKQPVVIHIGEGTDAAARNEIDRLIRWNYFNRELIGVHAVAMNEQQASHFRALVWCPASNDFLLGATAPVSELIKKTTLLFGTDSTLSAPWNSWDHLRLARNKKLAGDNELFDMLTVNAARIWNMNGVGRIAEGEWADIVVAKPDSTAEGWDAFYQLNPENILMVIHRGTIRLLDAGALADAGRTNMSLKGFSKIYMGGIGKYVQGDLPGLLTEIRRYNPDAVFPVSS